MPENFIAYVGSLVGRAIECYSCFISYSGKDQKFAERLHADLQANGVRCWYAPEDLKTGDRFRSRIDGAIRDHDKLLLILSKNSIASDWVQTEIEKALHLERQRNTPMCSSRSGSIRPRLKATPRGLATFGSAATSETSAGGRIPTPTRRRSKGC